MFVPLPVPFVLPRSASDLHAWHLRSPLALRSHSGKPSSIITIPFPSHHNRKLREISSLHFTQGPYPRIHRVNETSSVYFPLSFAQFKFVNGRTVFNEAAPSRPLNEVGFVLLRCFPNSIPVSRSVGSFFQASASVRLLLSPLPLPPSPPN